MYADLFDMFCFLHDAVVFQFILSTHVSCKFSIKMKRINEDVKKLPYHKYTLEFKKKDKNEAKKSSNKRKKSVLLRGYII